MDPRFILYSVVGMLLGVGLFIQGFRWLRKKRMIENIPTSKIRSIAMGLVEIFGEVVPQKSTLLKSPLRDKDCVYYKYTIEEHRSDGKNSRWVRIDRGEDAVPFLLKDATGSVLVDSRNAKVDLSKDYEFQSGFGKDPPATVQNFLWGHRMSHEGFLGLNKKMRYKEWIIEPRDNLYVMGTADDNPNVPDASKRQGVDDVMIHKGDNMYYISDKKEADLLKNLRAKTWGGLVFGALLIIGSLAGIFLFIGVL